MASKVADARSDEEFRIGLEAKSPDPGKGIIETIMKVIHGGFSVSSLPSLALN